MGFIHHQHGYGNAVDKAAEALVFKSLYRNHQDLKLTITGLPHDLLTVFFAQSGIQAGSRNTLTTQKCQLIMHQRNERRNHQCEMGQLCRGELITQRLT